MVKQQKLNKKIENIGFVAVIFNRKKAQIPTLEKRKLLGCVLWNIVFEK